MVYRVGVRTDPRVKHVSHRIEKPKYRADTVLPTVEGPPQVVKRGRIRGIANADVHYGTRLWGDIADGSCDGL